MAPQPATRLRYNAMIVSESKSYFLFASGASLERFPLAADRGMWVGTRICEALWRQEFSKESFALLHI
ncbi:MULTISPECIES: hypothetical protein [unclassified Sinorhizobium]|uniref:hypothetical protein n=1 Tax=unclassified Sinorhizobium TaxID=2613772 RepID=UPI0024C2D530|nr:MULTISPECIES: hypothetical protein [unclassified Sinorhizobium]MDK1373471.1 hypothetical protein [Sinorhizobium sp. 6-70]MDK1479706.1 hypothetical protein [Sinorhizobium sp. 6-117]